MRLRVVGELGGVRVRFAHRARTVRDRRFAAFAFHGGSVVVVGFASLRTSTAGPSPRARFPFDVAWLANGVRVRFDTDQPAPLRVLVALP